MSGGTCCESSLITSASPSRRKVLIQHGGASWRSSWTSPRAGVQYEIANGDEIPNLGEKLFAVVTEEGTVRGMRPQVADVSKALQSVRALVRTEHVVVFGDGESGTERWFRPTSSLLPGKLQLASDNSRKAARNPRLW